jgi:hypothetical protein
MSNGGGAVRVFLKKYAFFLCFCFTLFSRCYIIIERKKRFVFCGFKRLQFCRKKERAVRVNISLSVRFFLKEI